MNLRIWKLALVLVVFPLLVGCDFSKSSEEIRVEVLIGLMAEDNIRQRLSDPDGGDFWSAENVVKRGEALKCIRAWAEGLADPKHREAYLKKLEPLEEDFRVYTAYFAVPKPPEGCQVKGELPPETPDAAVVTPAGMYSFRVGGATSITISEADFKHKSLDKPQGFR